MTRLFCRLDRKADAVHGHPLLIRHLEFRRRGRGSHLSLNNREYFISDICFISLLQIL
jgi:hypothetical protein